MSNMAASNRDGSMLPVSTSNRPITISWRVSVSYWIIDSTSFLTWIMCAETRSTTFEISDTFDDQSTRNVRMRLLVRLSTLALTTAATLFWSAHLNKTFSPYNEFRMLLPGLWSAQECMIISRRISKLCTGFPSSIVLRSNRPQSRTIQFDFLNRPTLQNLSQQTMHKRNLHNWSHHAACA